MSDTKNTTKCIRGTRTAARIALAYISESTAYTRYIFYSQQAVKEGYPIIGEVFRVTANNELRHSKVFFKMLKGGKIANNVTIDAGVIGSTAENLLTAANEEQAEGVEQYTESARIAREEGFDDIAVHFEAIAKIENEHEARFRLYLKRLQEDTLYIREKPVSWQCQVCGYIYEGETPPPVCPACDHPRKFFMPVEDEFSVIPH